MAGYGGYSPPDGRLPPGGALRPGTSAPQLPIALPALPALPPPQALPGPVAAAAAGMEPFRSNWLALFENAVATDTTLVCGTDGAEVLCHRAVLISQSAQFRNRHTTTSGLPSRIDLPDLPAPAVRVFLRYLYTGLPAAMDCVGDPVLAVDTLHTIEAFAAEETDVSRMRSARRAVEAQLVEAMGTEAAARGLARMNYYGMRETFEACLPIFMQAAKNDTGKVVGLLEGMEFGAFLPAVRGAEWPGGEMQKFRIIRAWAEVNRATPEQVAQLARLIDLEKITLDDLEKEVEPSGLIPIQKLMKQYTIVARRLRAQSGLPIGTGPNVSLRQQMGLGGVGGTSSMPELPTQQPLPPPIATQPPAPAPAPAPAPPQPMVMMPGQPGMVPQSVIFQQPPSLVIPPGTGLPPSTNGLLNNGQPMNIVTLANGQTAVVGTNGVVMNTLPPGSVSIAAAAPNPTAVVPAVAAAAVQADGPPPPRAFERSMEQPQPRPSNASQKSRRREPREPAPAAPREPAPPMDDIPPAPAAPVQPSPSMGGDISAGFEGWVVPRGEVAASRMNLAFNSESVRSCRSAASISRGQWRWVIMVERIAPRVGSGSHALHFPDIGIMIGETFDPRQALRSQPNCCTWDGRDSICVNSMPIPYPRSRGGPLKDGEVIVVDLDLDARTLGFRRNGVDCGTSIRGFPGSVYLAVCGRYPTRIRWVGLSHVA